MEKMRMESPDLTAQNIEKIGALFPNCIVETVNEKGNPKRAVHFERLKQMLSGDVLEGNEAFEFTWVGKKAAMAEANRPIRKTLRPCREESVNWDTTRNLYIEGDNLEALKLLQESYLGAVKMIYVDPPYNTGEDFIYKDDFKISAETYDKKRGVFDEDGKRMFKNTDANGRFHSDWCSMMYSRMMLARNLLSDEGVILVSIDEHEHHNLLNMMNEVFGEANYIDSIVWNKKTGAKGVPPKNMMVNVHEYLVAYQKSDQFKFVGEQRDEKADGFKNPDHDPRGPWRESNIKSTSKSPEAAFTIVDPNTGKEYTNTWAFSRESLERMIREDRIIWKDSLPKQKEFLYEMTNPTKAIKSSWGVFDPQSTTVFLKHLIPEVKFDNPKPIQLMTYLIRVCVGRDDLVLDLFSGSATTAEAVMRVNAEDGGRRTYITVQIPQQTDRETKAYQTGYTTLCEIGKERIRRSGKVIQRENPEAAPMLDVGFRVLKVDDTNMTDVYYSADEYSQDLLSAMESNVKADRTDLDLLFGCLLEWGLPLTLPYTSEALEGCRVHTCNGGDLIACFDENIPDSVIRTIAKRQPKRAVFRDSSFASSPSKINAGEVFKLLAPEADVKVI